MFAPHLGVAQGVHRAAGRILLTNIAVARAVLHPYFPYPEKQLNGRIFSFEASGPLELTRDDPRPGVRVVVALSGY